MLSLIHIYPDDDIHLPSDVLEEAGIPVGATLRAYADDEEQTVTIGVAGATGSGKTTVAGWLLTTIPDNKRIFTIENGSLSLIHIWHNIHLYCQGAKDCVRMLRELGVIL